MKQIKEYYKDYLKVIIIENKVGFSDDKNRDKVQVGMEEHNSFKGANKEFYCLSMSASRDVNLYELRELLLKTRRDFCNLKLLMRRNQWT